MSKEIDHKTAVKLISSIIANQIALNFNEEIKHTTVYKHELKRKLNPAIAELIKAEAKDFDHLDKSGASNLTSFIHETQFILVKVIAELGVYSFGDVVQMIQAYKKNKEVMLWLADRLNDVSITEEEIKTLFNNGK